MRQIPPLFALWLILAFPNVTEAALITAYQNNFDGSETFASGVSGGMSGVTATASGAGFTGLGNGGNVFSGNLLHNDTGGTLIFGGPPPGSPTILTLVGLPSHTGINVAFLLAIIDSWDGTSGHSASDYLNIEVDGSLVFRESFDNWSEDGVSATYSPPAGTLLTFGSDVGFNPLDDDAAYDFAMVEIPHTASSLTISIWADGEGWQGSHDESWGIDNLDVQLSGVVPAPGGIVAMLSLISFGAGAVGIRRFRSHT